MIGWCIELLTISKMQLVEVQSTEKHCAGLRWRCAELSWRWVVNIKRGSSCEPKKTPLNQPLDTIRMELQMPPDKLEALTQLLEQWHYIKRKITKCEPFSPIGKPSFAAKVVGSLSGDWLISVCPWRSSIITSLWMPTPRKISNGGYISYQGGMESVSCCNHIGTPSLTCNCTQTPQERSALEHTSRVHGSVDSWSDTQFSRSIQWKELFAIVAATAAWGSKWKCKRILIHTDNQVIVHNNKIMANKKTKTQGHSPAVSETVLHGYTE